MVISVIGLAWFEALKKSQNLKIQALENNGVSLFDEMVTTDSNMFFRKPKSSILCVANTKTHTI